MALSKLLTRTLHVGHLAMRPMTLGVRAAVFDDEGQVLLVRHTYLRGWYLPGGGVEPGETAEAALRRELREEGNIEMEGAGQLVGVYFNRGASRRDHVLLFRCPSWRSLGPKLADREIAEAGFFSLTALPEGTTPATHRRIAEMRSGGPTDPYW